MAVEIATAYISLVPSARGLGKAVTNEFDAVGGAGEKAGQSLGGRLIGGVGQILKKGAIATGVAAGGALAVSIGKGIGRLTAIENAEAKLSGLGHSTATVSTIMENALGAVKGTAYGLGDAATVAASTVAAGIKPGEELRRVLGLTADTATIAGVSMGEMGDIFNKVAAQGKLTGREVNQLASQGVPILQMLADQYGVTAEEASKMVSEGKVSFADFADAIETNIAGSALKSGDTTQGALANVGAAAGRFGAQLLSGVFPHVKTVFGGMITLIDMATDAVGPWVDAFASGVGQVVGPVLQRISDVVTTGDLGGKFRSLGDGIGLMGAKLRPVIDAVTSSGFVPALAAAGAAVGGAFLDAVLIIGPALADLAPVLVEVGLGLGTHILGAVTALTPLVPPLATFVATLIDLVSKVPVGVLQAIGVALAGPAVAAAGLGAASAAVSRLAGGLKSITGPARSAVSGLVGFFKAGEDGYSGIDKLRLSVGMAGEKIAGIAKSVRDGAKALLQYGRDAMVAAANTGKQVAAWVAQKAAAVASTVATKAMAAAQWLLNAALAANPIGIAVIAIAALVAGLVVAYQKIGWFRDLVDAAFGLIRDVISGVFNWVTANWPTLLAVLTGPIGLAVLTITKHWDTIKDAFTAVKDWIGARVGDIVDFVKSIPGRIASTAAVMFNAVRDAMTKAKDWISDRVTDVVGFITGIPGRIAGAAATMFDSVKNAMTTAKNWVGDRVSEVVGFITGIPGRIADIASTMFNSVKDAMTTAKDWVIDRFEDVVDFFSRLPARIGRVVGGIKDALIRPFRDAASEIKGIWDGVVRSIRMPSLSMPAIQWPKLPGFHDGGIVPGRPGQEVLAVLKAGETVLPTHKSDYSVSPATLPGYDQLLAEVRALRVEVKRTREQDLRLARTS